MNDAIDKSPVPTGQMNLSAAFRAEYPRMMYRQTEVEQHQVQTTKPDGRPESWLVINRFNGLLCETTVVETPDEAEALSEMGWDSSPEAAYGIATGVAAQTSAKDEEIAALRAQVAALQGATEPPKRGPGRPPKQAIDEPTIIG